MDSLRNAAGAVEPRELGIAGLGPAAWPLAQRLARAGHRLAVFDPERSRIERFVAGEGGAPASSVAELGMRGFVLLGPREPGAADPLALLELGLAAGGIVVELGDRDPSQTRALGARLARLGVVLIDAPLLGDAAAQGIAVGCDDDTALAHALPVLDDMGLPIFSAGGLGAGQALRLLAAHVRARAFSAAAEALLVADALRLAPDGTRAALELACGLPLDAEGLRHGAGSAQDFACGLALGLLVRESSPDVHSTQGSPALTQLLIEFAMPPHNQETAT